MPFAVVPNPENTNEGGMGGTCVLRGCVPKKIMMYGRPNHLAGCNDALVTGFIRIQIILLLIVCWIFYARVAN